MSFVRRVYRTWFRLLGAGPLVLLLSILPSYVYLDHWGAYVAQAMGHEVDQESPAEFVTHAMHCHNAAGSCSEVPAPIGGRVLPAAVELNHPALAPSEVELVVRSIAGVTVVPRTEPPRAYA